MIKKNFTKSKQTLADEKNGTALENGSAEGLGQVFAERLAVAGNDLVLTGVGKKSLEVVAREMQAVVLFSVAYLFVIAFAMGILVYQVARLVM